MIGDNIKRLRIEHKLTQSQLCKMLGVAQNTLANYELNVRQPSFEMITTLADLFNISIDYLFDRDPIIANVPIIGTIRAGDPIFAEHNIEGFRTVPKSLLPSNDCFYLRVVGDSMNLAKIADGGLVLVRNQNEVSNGEIAVVIIDNQEATIKRFYKNGNHVMLVPQSTNPIYQPLNINLEQSEVRVIGKAIHEFIELQ